MLELRRIRSVVVLLLIAGLTSVVVGQGDKLQRPKEATVESVSADIDASLRSAIAEELKDKIDAAQEKLAAERADLKKLQQQLREQEKQVRQLDLKVQYLQDRLQQWLPTERANDVEQDTKQTETSQAEAGTNEQQEIVKP